MCARPKSRQRGAALADNTHELITPFPIMCGSGRLPMNEFALIDRFFRRAVRDPAVRIAIGDDGAVVAPASGCELAFSVDMLVEGRHFLAGVDPATLGHKTLAVNLSDMAAMGAKPRWALLAGALPDIDERWLARIRARLVRTRGPVQRHFDRRRHDARTAQSVPHDRRRSTGRQGTDPRGRVKRETTSTCRERWAMPRSPWPVLQGKAQAGRRGACASAFAPRNARAARGAGRAFCVASPPPRSTFRMA